MRSESANSSKDELLRKALLTKAGVRAFSQIPRPPTPLRNVLPGWIPYASVAGPEPREEPGGCGVPHGEGAVLTLLVGLEVGAFRERRSLYVQEYEGCALCGLE